MGVMNRIPLQWPSFLCVACWVLAVSNMADSAMTISDQTTYNSPSTCQYPCLPPPASVINCPPPPSPPSSFLLCASVRAREIDIRLIIKANGGMDVLISDVMGCLKNCSCPCCC
ncbi:uncharacterized protein LOC126410547 [Nymphaea colorata]|uniref:uncharacterized protein LOC126410547 n=1 Tax=Nymphaea colorata TaxID=210225 RepID=UPI00214E8A39|nr:uncharacterized protein LOC126410547 [Nymphaea colorata]